jgi:hypothetical protein
MNRLVQEIIKDLLPEEKKQITALYAGGFKPPTSGHFEVVETALKQNPEIDEFIIFIGSKERNGISQEESLLIWEVYNKYLPFKVKIEPSSAPPVKAVYDFAKNHPTREILWIIGAREGNEDDFKDLSSRTRSITNYPNIEVRTIITQGGVSGTAARNAAKVSFEKFEPFLPSVLTPEEKQEVYQMVSGKIQETLNEISLPKATQQISKLNPSIDAEQVAKDFIRLTPNLDKKDLFQYQTYGELEQALNIASGTKTQRRKQAKSMDLEDNEFIFYKDDNFTVYKLDNPSQHPESCEIAQGAKICVASNSKKYWNQYMVDGDGVLFYIRNKKYDIPHPESVIAFMFPRKGLKIGYTEMVDYNDEDFVQNGNYEEQKEYLNSIGLPSSVIEKMFKFIPKPEPLSYYISKYKGKKSPIKINSTTYKYYEPDTPPSIGAITVFEDENEKVIGTLKGYIYKINPSQQKWLKFKFPNLPQSQIYQINKSNPYYKENSKEVTLYSIENNKLVKTGNAHFPYGEKEIDILISGGELEVLERFKQLNENASYSQHIDIKQKIKELIKHMLQKGMNITPLPKIVFKHGDTKNAKEFLGKTAYYNPETMEIVLYTEGRHPKDIVRSFSHEMVHHTQNLEGRLGNVSTTNTLEDDHLDRLEQEANLNGTMTFRNWTDSLNEEIVGGKVICDNCGWSWDLKDGGEKPYLCHKCGYDNSLKLTKETFFEEEDRLMVEVVNPDGEVFEYKESNIKGLFVYRDLHNNLYFARIFFNPIEDNPHFEFKTGWFEDNNISKPKYNPHLPPNTTGIDNLKRRNTVGKIYRDEILPFFKQNQNLSNKLYIKPISHSRHIFSQRLVKNHTSPDFNIEEIGETLIISLPQNENRTKDPFGLNAYSMELGRLREEKTEYTIYCDMDGVLVDFDLGYQELTGITSQQADANGVEAFWSPLSKAGAKFWITLKWMSDGKQLWSYIKKYDPILLSAPSREESSRLGKRVWVKRELPGVKLILKSASQKQQYASPTSILIDDRQKNIDQWNAAGGVGILHTSTANTINQLKQLGL